MKMRCGSGHVLARSVISFERGGERACRIRRGRKGRREGWMDYNEVQGLKHALAGSKIEPIAEQYQWKKVELSRAGIKGVRSKLREQNGCCRLVWVR